MLEIFHAELQNNHHMLFCVFQGMHEVHSDIFQIRFHPKEIDHYAHYTQDRKKFGNQLPARVAGQMESSLGSGHTFATGVRIESLAHRRPAGAVPTPRSTLRFEYQRDRNLDRPLRQ